MPAFPTKFGGPVVSGLDRSPCVPVSSQNKNNNSRSIPRILCGIATLGISELVRVLCNYHAAKNEAKPEVQQILYGSIIITLLNPCLIHNKNLSFLELCMMLEKKLAMN